MNDKNCCRPAPGDEIIPKSAYFDIVREQLQFWPYTIHQIDDTLDAGLIEAAQNNYCFAPSMRVI